MSSSGSSVSASLEDAMAQRRAMDDRTGNASADLPPAYQGGETTTVHTDQEQTCKQLVDRINNKLSCSETDCIAVKDHRSAVNAIARLKRRLCARTEELDTESMIVLTTLGCCLQRRIHLGLEAELACQDLKITLALVFVLLLLGEWLQEERRGTEAPPACMEPLADQGEPAMMDVDAVPTLRTEWEETLNNFQATPLSAYLDIIREQLERDGSEPPELEAPARVCRACLKTGLRRARESTFAELSKLADVFFANTALALAVQRLDACKGTSNDDFLTLDCASMLSNVGSARDERLSAVVDAADSEAGMAVLRDLILSFSLPVEVVGTRRVPMLSRDTNKQATERYAPKLQEAHEAAMRGAPWSWSDDPNPLHQMCALLAGLAMLTCGQGKGSDAIRKNDAFAGRVLLPFFTTKKPVRAGTTKRLFWAHGTDEWIVFTERSKRTLEVHLRQAGLEGLCSAVLLLTEETS
tara:strand:- start:2705 stop:4111 length:1407 start_codon:yes stop_codon:yes gene_type:complete